MKKIPTAKTLIKNMANDSLAIENGDYTKTFFVAFEDVKCLMIEFAKLHCKKQAEIIAEKAKVLNIYPNHIVNEYGEIEHYTINKDSILNAYNLNNIK